MRPTRAGRRAPRKLLAALAATLVGLATACANAPAKPLPPSVPVVNVVMREYLFEHEPMLGAGRAVFRVRNAGQADHALTLVRLPEGLTLSVEEMLQGGTRRAFPTTARLLSRPPGSLGTFAVDLRPGRYALFCFLADDGGEQHVTKGMASEFEVG